MKSELATVYGQYCCVLCPNFPPARAIFFRDFPISIGNSIYYWLHFVSNGKLPCIGGSNPCQLLGICSLRLAPRRGGAELPVHRVGVAEAARHVASAARIHVRHREPGPSPPAVSTSTCLAFRPHCPVERSSPAPAEHSLKHFRASHSSSRVAGSVPC